MPSSLIAGESFNNLLLYDFIDLAEGDEDGDYILIFGDYTTYPTIKDDYLYRADVSAKQDGSIYMYATLGCIYVLSDYEICTGADSSYLFNGCTNVTSIIFENFNTSNETNMECMFAFFEKLETLDVTKFNTSKVTNMADMFYFCYVLQSINLTSCDTSKVTDMSYMFTDCYALETLDLKFFKSV